MSLYCTDCNHPLGITDGPPESRCTDCETKWRVRWMLRACPDKGTEEFDALSDWEQAFLPSAREHFDRRGKLSELQYQCLEEIFEKTA